MHFSGLKGSVITIMACPKIQQFAGNIHADPLMKTAKSCASEEKVKYTKKKGVRPELDGYRLFDVNNLLNFVSVFPSPSCGGSGYTVTEEIAGLHISMSFKCVKPNYGSVDQLQSQPEGESVNTRFEMAMFSIGRNPQQAERLLGEMNMPPPVSSTMWNKG